MDLSIKQQFIDLIILRKGSSPVPRPLPDGFEDLAEFNLVTFKSFHEPLDSWALCELLGHYVNYRKQASPSLKNLLPPTAFRLFAVCVRFPRDLAQQVTLTPVGQGVYDIQVLELQIRVIVIHQLPEEEQNAMLLLFSDQERLLRYARDHYRPHSTETSTLLYELFKTLSEVMDMSDKLDEFVRQSLEKLLKSLPPQERLKGLSPKERLEGLSADELAQALPPETLEALTQKRKTNGSSTS